MLCFKQAVSSYDTLSIIEKRDWSLCEWEGNSVALADTAASAAIESIPHWLSDNGENEKCAEKGGTEQQRGRRLWSVGGRGRMDGSNLPESQSLVRKLSSNCSSGLVSCLVICYKVFQLDKKYISWIWLSLRHRDGMCLSRVPLEFPTRYALLPPNHSWTF